MTDGGFWSSKIGTCSMTYLDKDQNLLIAHDQIDFSASAPVVARDELQPPSKQVLQGDIFGLGA